MKRALCLALTLTALLLVALPASAQADFAVGKADDFITALSRGDYQKAYGMVDSNLGFNSTVDQWKNTWNSLTGKAGKFVEFRKNEVQPGDGYNIVVQVCKFEKGLVDLHVAVNNQGQIAGFAIKNHKATPADSAPPQASAAPPADAPAEAGKGGA